MGTAPIGSGLIHLIVIFHYSQEHNFNFLLVVKTNFGATCDISRNIVKPIGAGLLVGSRRTGHFASPRSFGTDRRVGSCRVGASRAAVEDDVI